MDISPISDIRAIGNEYWFVSANPYQMLKATQIHHKAWKTILLSGSIVIKISNDIVSKNNSLVWFDRHYQFY